MRTTIRFTERIGDVELVYEGETIEDVLALKAAIEATEFKQVTTNNNINVHSPEPKSLSQITDAIQRHEAVIHA